jgi:hypothetical protein
MAGGATRRCLQELAAVARSARGVQGVTTVEPAEAAAVAERDQPQILPADHDAVVLAHLDLPTRGTPEVGTGGGDDSAQGIPGG